MPDTGVQIRCQRCGDAMDMVDPAAGQAWTPNQYWTCKRCGRHFWTSYTADPSKPVVKAPPSTPPSTTPGATTPATTPATPLATTLATPLTPSAQAPAATPVTPSA